MIAQYKTTIYLVVLLLALNWSALNSCAFSLLGPFAPWMEETNGLRQPEDIGGPMDIGSGYRWNVPVVTYGFDKTFLDYFGSNGVVAVESAIQILNNLPSASSIVLTNYPLDSQQVNYAAQVLSLYDLKSETLSLLLEQMGLAQPTRYIFVLRQWDPIFLTHPNEDDWPDGTIPNYIMLRNFNPGTFLPSFYVNQVLFGSYIESGVDNVIFTFRPDPNASPYSTVAEHQQVVGGYHAGLTKDDVGGLQYLLSSNNINYESQQPILPKLGNRILARQRVINGVWRPGVEKITFVAQSSGAQPGSFRPMTLRFTDVYLRNNIPTQHRIQRIVLQPDFLFSAADTGEKSPLTPWTVRTGTTNWLNYAVENGNPSGEGPGVIVPPIKITFHKLGCLVWSGDNYRPQIISQNWASFDGSTNSLIVYPTGTPSGPMTVRLRYFNNSPSPIDQIENQTWHLLVPVGGTASLQVSLDQINWTPLVSVTNTGAVIEWYYIGNTNSPKSFRIVPN